MYTGAAVLPIIYVLGSSIGAASAINPGVGGSITGSIIYCYTGTSTTTNKVVGY